MLVRCAVAWYCVRIQINKGAFASATLDVRIFSFEAQDNATSFKHRTSGLVEYVGIQNGVTCHRRSCAIGNVDFAATATIPLHLLPDGLGEPA